MCRNPSHKYVSACLWKPLFLKTDSHSMISLSVHVIKFLYTLCIRNVRREACLFNEMYFQYVVSTRRCNQLVPKANLELAESMDVLDRISITRT
jgi:hypothetical protein